MAWARTSTGAGSKAYSSALTKVVSGPELHRERGWRSSRASPMAFFGADTAVAQTKHDRSGGSRVLIK